MPEPSLERMFELLAISREIASATDHALLPSKVIEHTARFLDANVAVLLLADENGRASIAASVGLPRGAASFEASLDESIGEKVCRVFGCDPDRFLAAPVIESGRIQGILAVQCRGTTGPDEDALLSGLADQAAIALANTRHVDRLERALEMLREADQRKDEFLGILSHEVRNPLAPIRASIYILDHTDSKSEAAMHARLVLKRQTDHLTRLIDDLLDMTRITRGRISISHEPIDVVDLVRRVADDHRSMMTAAELTLIVKLDSLVQRVWVSGDPTRLAQVVGNLLQNAARFTPAGGEVALSVCVAGTQAEIRVRDTGRGIDPLLQQHIFEPFVQVQQSVSRSHGGLGLGLSLVKEIVQLHDGTVRVESDGKDRGSEFIVALPLTTDAPDRAPDREAHSIPSRVKRVLIVDDNHDAADTLAEVVKMLGHSVEVAYDGPSAMDKVLAQPPDAVLCDLGLPRMDGYEVARAIRRKGIPTRLIAISGYAQPDDVRKSHEAGFEAHLAKPADPLDVDRLLSVSSPPYR